ncbi:indole-3-glycerol phosphate synthase TrpC [Chryseobacterium gossypii]|uniref:indole-3-glycerol phosphate synthase TrpC n=1 Tax=Chryseobacterium gossypii TaxID=3231602 RepID=UPI003525E258
MTILDKIIENKKEEIMARSSQIPVEKLTDSGFFRRKIFSLKESIKNRNGIIAEFKRQSPSKGIINDKASPLYITSAYEHFGASGVSILTDKDFFGGSIDDIIQVRDHIGIPVLRKDFMIGEYQFYEAKSIGADAVLLIAACLSPAQVREFTELSHELGLEVLLEIHTEEELKHYNPEIDMVGINNRNLKDFRVDLHHSARLKSLLPANALTVAESGIYSIEDFCYLKDKGFDGFLMGEYFMKQEDPAKAFEDVIKTALQH